MHLNTLTATEAAAGIAAGDFTSEEVVRASLERIAEREQVVAAWAHLVADYALAQARARDDALRNGAKPGPLHGVPVGIKDVIDTDGLPTENGTPIFAGRQPAHDASVVAQLIGAGAVILGKTVTTELAFFGPGKTRNPANPRHTPGGSSSGSAAAVADWQVPLALGTQTAGSILRPASYCGVIGWKPTFGLISRTGVLAQSPPLDTIGAFARSLDDIALVTDCMSGADRRDPDMGPRPSTSLMEELAAAQPAARLRFAFVRTAAWSQGDESMHAAFEAFITRLGAGLVQEVRLPESFARGTEAQRAIQFHDIAKNYGPLVDANRAMMSDKLAEVVALGREVTGPDYESALDFREPLYAELMGLIQGFDAILTPAAADPAPHGLASTGSPAFNGLWTYLRAPTISLPLLEARGLPLGVQLVGRRGEDGALLRSARALLAACA